MNTEKFEVIGEDIFVDKPVEPSQPAVTENPRVGVDHYDETPPAKAPEDKAKTQEKEVPPEKSTPPEKPANQSRQKRKKKPNHSASLETMKRKFPPNPTFSTIPPTRANRWQML